MSLRSAQSHRDEVDVEHRASEIAAIAVDDGFPDVGIEFELVLDVFGRKQRAVIEPPDVLGPIDDLEMPGLRVDEPGIAGPDVTVGGDDLGGLGLIPEIAHEHAWRLEQHLPILGDAQVDIPHYGTDCIGTDVPVGLRGDVEEGLGLTVELLEVQSDRAKEREQVGADRLAAVYATRTRDRPSTFLSGP